MEATRSKCFLHRRELLWQICHLYLWACVPGYRCERACLGVFAAAWSPAMQLSRHWKFYNVQYCFHLTFIIHWTSINVSCQSKCACVCLCACVFVCGFNFSLHQCDYLSISFYFLQLRVNNSIVHLLSTNPPLIATFPQLPTCRHWARWFCLLVETKNVLKK